MLLEFDSYSKTNKSYSAHNFKIIKKKVCFYFSPINMKIKPTENLYHKNVSQIQVTF